MLIPAAHRVTIGATRDPARHRRADRLVVLVAARSSRCSWTRSSLAAEAETRQIRSVLEQVRKFESQKALLQQRVTLIEQLRKGQYAPVHVLDEISKSLPDRLWLSELTQTGAEFTLGGMTDSLTAVSDFVANLESTRWFKKPVEIVDSQVQTDAKAGDLIRFVVKAQFVDPTRAAGRRQAGGRARRRK